MLEIRGLLVQGDAGVAWAPNVAFDVANDLPGIGEVGYRAAKRADGGFVADNGYVGTFGVKELFLMLLAAGPE